MIPTQILRVLSTFRAHHVPALLMGGQACVLYGAAEYSRDLDLAVLATDDGIGALRGALEELDAEVIADPPFHADFLRRGHAVHFGVPAPLGHGTSTLRVDVVSTLRGVAPFPELWERRSTLVLDDDDGRVVEVDIMALPDLVQAKKTQRDKDWPMIRRLVDASYAVGVDRGEPTAEQVTFWLRELRTPEFLRDAVVRFPAAAHASTRAAVQATLAGADIEGALDAERQQEVARDRAYWLPLRGELEALRHAARRGA